LKKKLNLLLAAKRAGNDSKQMRNDAMEIIDLLLQKHQLTKQQHKQIFNFLAS